MTVASLQKREESLFEIQAQVATHDMVTAYIVMACIGMAYPVMACITLDSSRYRRTFRPMYRYGLNS